MCPALDSRIRGASGSRPRRAQQGAATLIVVMVLFFIISLVAAYTSRNLIFEQRTANNQYRSTQALEVAEAGLEWAISMLNHGRIDNACATSTNPADGSFRQRYLDVDNTGRIAPDPNPGGGELTPSCVFNGAGWTCSCPSTGAPSLTAPTAAGVWPAFRVRFQIVIPRDAANPAIAKQPGVVRIQVVGCTRLDAPGSEACLTFDGQGASNEGRVLVSSMLALSGGASSPPLAALTARGQVNVVGGTPFAAYNTGAAGSGITIQSGGTIIGTVPTLVSSPGSPGGMASAIQNDAALLLPAATPFTSNDRMFAAVFNTRAETMRTQQAGIELSSCPCSAAQVRAAASLNPWRPIWVNGDLIGDSAGDIGSAALPVLLVVNGNLQFTVTGVTIYGLVYNRLPTGVTTWDTTGAAAGQVIGAAVAENDLGGTGTPTFAYDADVIRLLRWNTGTFVRVPSSWKDYQ